MYLATVTCNKDFQQMLLQAESIQRFLNPCKHIIIINEEIPDINFWYRWLSPYYTNHELVIIPRIDISDIYSHYLTHYLTQTNWVDIGSKYFQHAGNVHEEYKGWILQQIQKLLLAYKYQDDYLLLDSKNFFIKNTDINEWENVVGSNKFSTYESDKFYGKTYKRYEELFSKKIKHYLSPCTPFKIKKKSLVSKCSIFDLWSKFSYPGTGSPRAVPSEFIFYSFFVETEEYSPTYPQISTDIPECSIIWKNSLSHLQDILNLIKIDPNIKITGIHRDVLSTVNESEFKILVEFVNSPDNGLGFINTIYQSPRSSYVLKLESYQI
jgi:hypothetical protein